MEKNSLIKKVEGLSEAEKLEMFKVEELETRLELLVPIEADLACIGELDAACFDNTGCQPDTGCFDGNCPDNDTGCNGSCNGSCGGW